MKLVYDTPNVEKLEQIIEARGFTVPKFTAILNGEGTGRNVIKEIKSRPDMRSSTLVKICRALNISIDVLFSDDTFDPATQTIVTSTGSNFSSSIGGELASLRNENETLKSLIDEKDKRISELKNHIETLSESLELLKKVGRKWDAEQ